MWVCSGQATTNTAAHDSHFCGFSQGRSDLFMFYEDNTVKAVMNSSSDRKVTSFSVIYFLIPPYMSFDSKNPLRFTLTGFISVRCRSAPGRDLPIAVHNPNVSFLRNGNQFLDSGPLHVALHEATHDPQPTFLTNPTQQRITCVDHLPRITPNHFRVIQ